MPTILIITRNYRPAICGVGDHTAHLKRELEKMGNRVLVLTGTGGQNEQDVFSVAAFNGRMYSRLQTLITEENIGRILWQYVPYSYQRKGLPLWWPLLMLRLAGSGVKQFVFFHEVSLRWWGYGLRQLVLASGQRMIANLASLAANGLFTSIPLYAGYFVFKKPGIVPISANIMVIGENVNRQSSVVSGDLESCRAESVEASNPVRMTVVNNEWSEVNSQRSTVSSQWDDQGPVNRQPSTLVRRENQVFCFANRADRALLQAIKNINGQFPVTLVLGGMIHPDKKAPLVDWIGELNLEDMVCFTGTMAPEALAGIIKASAIFLQPQIVERKNQGGISAKNGTVMAAMAMGKAIITCAGDMTDPTIFKPNENILLVPYGDGLAYEKALVHLLERPAEMERLGTAAAAIYRERCSWEVTGRMINDSINH
ncbi:hypothetical protein BH10BAC3_BH10BAC3_33810 [soil metagenome]